jgi:hypothetical protein
VQENCHNAEGKIEVYHPRIPYLAKLLFGNEDEIKTPPQKRAKTISPTNLFYKKKKKKSQKFHKLK